MNREYITIGKLNDIKGFFRTYQELRAEHFSYLFGEIAESDVKTLDYCLSDLYGSKCLQSRFTDIYNKQSANECMNRIVILADKLYFENWLNTKQTIEKALTTDLNKPLTSEKTGKNTTENKVNAFDSVTSSDKDNTTHNYSETTQYSNGKTATQNAKTQIDFTRNNDFLEIIINDILSMCCLSIYDDSYTPCHCSSGGGESDPELENRVTQCENDITDIKKLIPTTATEQNKLATIADVQSGYDDTELRGLIQENTENINGIYDDLTNYATKQELQVVENQIPDVSGLATKQELQAVENNIPDVSGLATKQELQAVENSIPDVTNLATKAELQEVQNSIPDVTNLATKTEVQAINDLIPSNASKQNKLATMADIGGGGGGGGGGSYYTVGQEVDTGNIYKDGTTEKHIYRRVINVSSVTQGSDVDVNVYFAGVTRFINITGSYNLNGIRHGMGYYNQNGTKGVQAEVRMSLVRFSVMGSGLTFTDVTLIIEYIK